MIFTIQALIDRARIQSDMTDTSFVEDSQALTWANFLVKRLDVMLARSGYLNAPTRTLTPVTGVDAYNFPAPVCIVTVHWVSTDGKRLLRLRPSHLGTNYPVLAARRTTAEPPTSWYAETKADGTIDLRFDPLPTSGSFLLTTVAEKPVLTLTDTVNYPAGVEDWITLEMARRMVVKEEGDPRALKDLIKDVEQYIEVLGQTRQQLDPPNWQKEPNAFDEYEVFQGFYFV